MRIPTVDNDSHAQRIAARFGALWQGYGGSNDAGNAGAAKEDSIPYLVLPWRQPKGATERSDVDGDPNGHHSPSNVRGFKDLRAWTLLLAVVTGAQLIGWSLAAAWFLWRYGTDDPVLPEAAGAATLCVFVSALATWLLVTQIRCSNRLRSLLKKQDGNALATIMDPLGTSWVALALGMSVVSLVALAALVWSLVS